MARPFPHHMYVRVRAHTCTRDCGDQTVITHILSGALLTAQPRAHKLAHTHSLSITHTHTHARPPRILFVCAARLVDSLTLQRTRVTKVTLISFFKNSLCTSHMGRYGQLPPCR